MFYKREILKFPTKRSEKKAIVFMKNNFPYLAITFTLCSFMTLTSCLASDKTEAKMKLSIKQLRQMRREIAKKKTAHHFQ